MPGMKKTRSLGAVLAAALALVLAPAIAEASYERRALVIAKVLSYESTLKERAGDSLDIVVLYKSGDANDAAESKGWQAAFEAIAGTRVQGLPIAVRSTSDVADAGGGNTDVIIVCEGLEANAAPVRALSRRRGILTVGSSRKLVADGMTLAVLMQGTKPKIVVNLPASKQERIRFQGSLLRLASVLR